MGTCNGHLQCLIFWFGTLFTYRLLTDDVLLRQLCADWTSANCTTAECSGCPVFEQLVEVATQELLPRTSTNDTAESIRGTVKEFWISLKDPWIDGKFTSQSIFRACGWDHRPSRLQQTCGPSSGSKAAKTAAPICPNHAEKD